MDCIGLSLKFHKDLSIGNGDIPANKVHLTRTVYLDEKYINGTIHHRNDMRIGPAVCHNSGSQVAMPLVGK